MPEPSIAVYYLNTDKGSIPMYGYIAQNEAVQALTASNPVYYNSHMNTDEYVDYNFGSSYLRVGQNNLGNGRIDFYIELYSNGSRVGGFTLGRSYQNETPTIIILGIILDTDTMTEKFGYWTNTTQSANVQTGGFFPAAVGSYPDVVYYTAFSEWPAGWTDIIKNGSSANKSDPYNPGGTSGTGGGTGNFDGTGDLIDIPNLPTLSAVDTGMISLYAPSVSDLHALANYLWGSLDLSNWNRILTDPLDAVLGLSIVPVSAPKGTSKNVWVGNINTNVPMVQYASQYVEVDCGTLNVNEYWGSYLDYDPYTKAELFLPYIGARPIAVDDIMGKSVHVVYHVDILSGACVAYVSVDGTVLYNFIGQCSCSVPISGGDWTNVLNGILQISSAVGMMVATEGASIPATIGAAGSAASGLVNAMRPNIEKSGAMSGMGGMMGVQTPYLILTRPRQCLPANQNVIEGYPSFITAQLGTLTGFTIVHKIELFDIGATREEYAEIEMLLAEGVIL